MICFNLSPLTLVPLYSVNCTVQRAKFPNTTCKSESTLVLLSMPLPRIEQMKTREEKEDGKFQGRFPVIGLEGLERG